ncbi:GL10727 [Drosophila persimilis]|uniref:Autophagy-related protein 9 n=1 Tax=Drosophila persimilis TaxID=7234 RepID=B4GAC6_DROPE|nr:GL10727 [Drosophila persimilis]
MSSPNINYSSLAEANPFREPEQHDEATTKADDAKSFTAAAHLDPHNDHEPENEDTPRNSGIMIHMVPETGRARWNHIEDLDSFFSRMYNYQQKHGFQVIVLDEVFQVLEFGFVVWLLTFVTYCIKHDVLFGDTLPPGSNPTKTTLSDVGMTTGECVAKFSWFTYLVIFIAAIYLGFRVLKMIYHITQYADIKKFYNTALVIEDNGTWTTSPGHELRDEFAVRSNQTELAQRLSKLILGVALVNLLLSPVIFIWQLIYFSFSYANILRKEPSALGLRTWSNYGRLYLRHFNELDHELDARLNRAYEYADRYLSSFSSPLAAVIARNLLFVSGGLLLLILAFGIYEEHVFQVEHVLTIIAVLTVVGVVARTMIPDENMIWCPEQLMTAILAHVHYLPTEWKQHAHTALVRNEFSNFFQFKAGYLLSEIFSPFVTPFVLIFVFRPKAMEIVKFFRTFTVSVRGVGNVCSFAQMDVRKHGNPDWQLNSDLEEFAKPQQTSLVGGKTEMSLVRFTLNNPEWQMPKEASLFIKGIREHAIEELVQAKTSALQDNPLTHSLISFGTIGEEYCSIANSVLAAQLSPTQMELSQSLRPGGFPVAGSDFRQMLQQNLTASVGPLDSMRRLRLSRAEGRLEGPADTLLYSLYGVDPRLSKNPMSVGVADMCLSALYLHELSQQKRKARQSRIVEMEDEQPGPSHWQRPPGPGGAHPPPPASTSSRHNVITSKAAESTPLLGSIRS